MDNKKQSTDGLKMMGQPLETIGDKKKKEREEELKKSVEEEKEQIKKSANHPLTKITGKDIWINLKEILFVMNNISDRIIRLEMYFENLQEYINKTGKLEILNKSDEYNQPLKKKEIYLDKKD
uniref:Uncharacterized protein n=1 Tax=viral metagenome TaxID=1070528 RepID=A0A6M3JKU2_9ZZZZ